MTNSEIEKDVEKISLDARKIIDDAESKRIRPHYFNLTRKEYVVTRSDVRCYEMRFTMKLIGWSSKDDIVYIDNWNMLASDEFPLLWDEERNCPGAIVSTFKRISDEPIDALFAYYDMSKHMRNLWCNYLKTEHNIDLDALDNESSP